MSNKLSTRRNYERKSKSSTKKSRGHLRTLDLGHNLGYSYWFWNIGSDPDSVLRRLSGWQCKWMDEVEWNMGGGDRRIARLPAVRHERRFQFQNRFFILDKLFGPGACQTNCLQRC